MKIEMNRDAIDLRGERNYENLLATDKSVPYNNERKMQKDNVCEDDNGQSDLHIYYQNAVNCLVHCDSVITNLQEQLSFKDEQIASLEMKLIETKLELASTKALQDEQSQAFNRIKRRISSIDDSENAIVNDLVNCCNKDSLERCVVLATTAASNSPHPQHEQQQCCPLSTKTCTLSSSSVNYASATVTQKDKHGARGDCQLSQSWSASNRYQSEVMPWPDELDDDTSAINEDYEGLRNHQDLKPQGGFRRFAQRLSWGISPDDSASEEIDRRVQIYNLDHNIDASMSSRSTADGSSVSPKNGNIVKAAAVKDSKFFVISDTSLYNNSPAAATVEACAKAVSSERHLLKKQQHSSTFLDDSQKVSIIGHFLLGSNKNGKGSIKTTPSAKMKNNNYEGIDPSPQHQRKFSSSSRLLEGVLFPVSSDDCLVDLWVEEKAASACLKSRTSVSKSGNRRRMASIF